MEPRTPCILHSLISPTQPPDQTDQTAPLPSLLAIDGQTTSNNLQRSIHISEPYINQDVAMYSCFHLLHYSAFSQIKKNPRSNSICSEPYSL